MWSSDKELYLARKATTSPLLFNIWWCALLPNNCSITLFCKNQSTKYLFIDQYFTSKFITIAFVKSIDHDLTATRNKKKNKKKFSQFVKSTLVTMTTYAWSTNLASRREGEGPIVWYIIELWKCSLSLSAFLTKVIISEKKPSP